ncbi:MAG: hypothetical protein PHD29_03750 [bacterium]|nr:hypothetical protein [bacterium]MDD5755807.1 hypothetical protein [bacterium]
MKKKILKTFGLFLLALSYAGGAWSAALTVNYADIVLENLQPGVPASLLQRAGSALGVNNTGSLGDNIYFEILIPNKSQLAAGYEPIPNVSWLKPERISFWVKANETENLDLIVYAPYDPKLFGRKYQAILMVYTLAGAGVMQDSIKTRVFLNFSSEPYGREALNKKVRDDQTNDKIVMIYPKMTSISKVSLKRKLDFSRMVVTNNSNEKITLALYAVGLANAPALARLISFKNPVIELNNKESKSIDLSIDLPLLKLKKDRPILILIGAKDTANPPKIGQFGLLIVQFN